MRTNAYRSLTVLLALLLMLGSSWTLSIQKASAAPDAPVILYVKEGGAGLQDGHGWNNAFATLQDAMDAANTSGGDTYEIWMAAGTYVPTKTNSSTTPSNVRTRTFQLKNGVTVLGGFPEDAVEGVGVPDRDPYVHHTILSGDLNGDDDPNDPNVNRSDNAYHVFYHPAELQLDHTAVLDGVTLTGGNANHTGTGINTSGAAMFNVGSSPILRHVNIYGNAASNLGGGILNSDGSHPTLQYVSINANAAGNYGGGLYNMRDSHPTINLVRIFDNRSAEAGGMGSFNSSPTISNTEIFNNSATLYGGGMQNLGGAPTLSNVRILNNTAGESGGGIENYVSNPELTNVAIAGNAAGMNGGGITNYESSPIFANVAIIGNKAEENGGGVFLESNTEIVLKNVTVSGNQARAGGGIYQLDNSETRLHNSIVWGNLDLAEGESNLIGDDSSVSDMHSSLVGPPFAAAPAGIDVNGISADKLFVAPVSASLAPTLEGNYRLRRTSPAVDRGDNALVPDPNGTDLDGFDRMVNATVDIGSYEYQGLWTWPAASQLTVSDVTTSGMKLSWPAGTGMMEFEGYRVYANGRLMDEGTDTELTLSGLADTTVYQVEVYPYDSYGYESEALRAEVSTVVGVPTANPPGGTIQAGSLVTLSASAGAQIYYTTDHANPTKSSQVYTGPIQLTENTTIRAFAAKDGHPDSGMLTAAYTVLPAPPLHLSGIVDYESVTLGWSASPGSVTYAVYQYNGTAAPVNPGDWGLVEAGVAATQYTVNGLENGTSYAFAVSAVNAEGASSLSNVFVAVPSDKTAPQWPTNSILGLSAITQSGVKLNWPEATDNVAVMHYKLYIDSSEYKSVTASVYESTVTGLQAGTPYTFTVKALDAAGNESAPLQDQAVTLLPPDSDEGGSSGGSDGNAEPGGGREPASPDPEGRDDAAEPVAPDDEPRPSQEQPAARLSDIGSHWAASFIRDAVTRGLVQGYPDGTFRPEQAMTRAEFAVVLAKALRLRGGGTTLPFMDRDAIGSWARPSIVLAVEAGLLRGYEDNRFRPDRPITRAEIAVIIARGLGVDTAAYTATAFADDADIPAWARGAVEAMRREGLLAGRGGANFAPNAAASRAEVVVLLIRTLEAMQAESRQSHAVGRFGIGAGIGS